MPTKPTNHTVWVTDGDTNKQVQPMSGKQLLGWVVNDKPPFQTWNWLHWNSWQWETYFEQITDLHSSQIATLNTAIGTLANASGITAANAGHTTATGVNVQVQLDQLDTAIKNIEDAVTGGMGIDLVGYVPASPGNWNATIPTHAGPALDQLAQRMRTVEAATSGANYDDKNFYDFFVPADSPIGAGNTGLTDNNNTNPRGIKLADGKLLYGEERIYFREIVKTGNYDANGLVEWAPTSPTNDVRVRLYGSWALVTGSANAYLFSPNAGDYMLITAVCDGVTVLSPENTTGADLIEVWVDGVDTSTQFSERSAYVTPRDSLCQVTKFYNNQMLGLPQGLHTFKLVNGASDASIQFLASGVAIINTTPLELASTYYLQKVQTSYAQQVPTLATANSNGGRSCRYIDRADGIRKEVVSNGYTFNTAITGSISSGATGFTLNSAAGLGNNDLLLIFDGPGNSEIVLANSVNTFSGAVTIAGAGLKNNYTNPSVQFYGRVAGAVNHALEKKTRLRHWSTMGTSSNSGLAMPVQLDFSGVTTVNTGWMEDGGTRMAFNGCYNRPTSWNANEPDFNTINFSAGHTDSLVYEGFFTGLDVFVNGGSNGSIAGQINIAIDGIIVVSNLTLVKNKNFWLKICSDLPLGNHIVTINSNDPGAFQYGFGHFQEYMVDDSSIEKALANGNALSHRNIVADYVWNSHQMDSSTEIIPSSIQGLFPISKGVVRQHWMPDAQFQGSWAGGAGESVGGYQAGILANTNVTNDKVIKTFFGTGCEIRFQKASNYGIAQIQVDGLNLTSGNFPSAVLQGPGFATGTGLLDFYDPGVIQASVSFANLSATPKLHTITMTCTGTKNLSSSGYYMNIQCYDIIGAVHYADNVGGNAPMHNQILGGIHDIRAMSFNGVDVQGRRPGFHAISMTSSYGVGSGDQVIPDGFAGDLYLPEDSLVEATAVATMRTTGSGDLGLELVVDGTERYGSVGQIFAQQSAFPVVSNTQQFYLKKGWHQVACQISYSGSGSGYVYGYYRFLSVKTIPQQRIR